MHFLDSHSGSPGIELQAMEPDHYDSVLALWESIEGIGLSSADQREPIQRYLARNPGFSLVALTGENVVGAALCGHDGRRGFIHHLAVKADHRRRGVGRALAARCLAILKEYGIEKCHIFVFAENPAAIRFWKRTGWFERNELVILSRFTA